MMMDMGSLAACHGQKGTVRGWTWTETNPNYRLHVFSVTVEYSTPLWKSSSSPEMPETSWTTQTFYRFEAPSRQHLEPPVTCPGKIWTRILIYNDAILHTSITLYYLIMLSSGAGRSSTLRTYNRNPNINTAVFEAFTVYHPNSLKVFGFLANHGPSVGGKCAMSEVKTSHFYWKYSTRSSAPQPTAPAR